MKKLLLLLSLTGCNGYESQNLIIPEHKIIIYESRHELNIEYKKRTLKDDLVDGFFDSADNSIHCSKLLPEDCLLHEYKHLLSKYGLIIPENHFKREEKLK